MIKVRFSEECKTNQSGELIWSRQTKTKSIFGIRFYKFVFEKSVDDSDFIPQEMPTKAQVIGFVSRINTRGIENQMDDEEEQNNKKITKHIRKPLGG